MITVGIRNLKDSLSKYLKLVKDGERIVITDHNQIIAEIVPATSPNPGSERLQEYLKEQEASGKLLPALFKKTLASKRTNKNPADQKHLSDIYEETRSDRG